MTVLILNSSENWQQNLDSPNDKEFTEEKILVVLEKSDPGKAPGEDGSKSDIQGVTGGTDQTSEVCSLC